MGTRLQGWELLDDLRARAQRSSGLRTEFDNAQRRLESMTQEQAEGPEGERLTLWQHALDEESRERSGQCE